MQGRVRGHLSVLLLLVLSWFMADVLSNWMARSQELPFYYLTADQVPFFREPNGESFGLLEVTTELKLLEQGPTDVQSPSSRVEVTGWVRINFQGQPTKLMFTDTERQIRVGIIEDVSQMTVLETIETTTPRWAKVQVPGWVWTDKITPDREGLMNQAMELYHKTCSTCHVPHEPAEFISRDWPAQIQNMIELGMIKNVPESDLNLILKYLQANAPESKEAPETETPPEPGTP